jgi:hypothetical protein
VLELNGKPYRVLKFSMINMNAEQERFLREEFLTMAINGALQHNPTYLKSASEKDQGNFRQELRREIKNIAAAYTTTVAAEMHFLNIQKLADDLTHKYSRLLMGGRFRIGTAQKVLNLYLKYLWCCGLIPLPPHCPFDNRIIKALPGCADLEKWTRIDKIDDYARLVEATKKKAQSLSLSEWELQAWNG